MESSDFNREMPDDEVYKRPFELTNVNKFVVLYVVSLGLYAPWWFYKSWKFFKEEEGLDIAPALRAIFAIFFTYQLFEKIQYKAQANGYAKEFSSSLLFVIFIGLTFVGRAPAPYWCFSLLAVAPLLYPVLAFNFSLLNDENYDATEPVTYNMRQLALVIIGGLIWLLVLFSLLFGPEF